MTGTMPERLTQADLHRWLNYEPDTGVFTWRQRPPRAKIAEGAIAGSLHKHHGKMRRMLWVDGRRIYASRAAFIYVNGDIPVNALVDHIDGDTTNDRLCNLRLASDAQNVWNKLAGRDGAKYLKGVTKGDRGRYRARILAPDGRSIFLGTWQTEAEAHAAYMGASAVLHGEFSTISRGDDGGPAKALEAVERMGRR